MPELAPRPAGSPKLLSVANVLAAQLSTAVVTLGAFVITPALLDALGASAYGVWLLINSLVGYMRLLDLGMSAATMKYGAGAYERADGRDLARVFDTTSAAFLAISAGCAALTLALATLLPRLYPVLEAESGTIVILGAAIAIELGSRTYAAALRTRSLFVVHDSVEIVTYSIFKFGLVLYLASRGLDLRLLALVTLAETVVRNAVVIASALVLCPFARRLRPYRLDASMLRRLSGMGTAMSIIQVADLVRFQLDAAVIAYFMPTRPDAISIFGIGTRLPSIAFHVVGVIGGVMVPRFSGLWEKGGDGAIRLLRKTSTATGLLSAYVFVNLAVLGPNFLALWLGKPWVVESGRILLLLLPAYFVALLGNPAVNLLVGRGQVRALAALHVAEAVANFVLSVALVRRFGIYGVAAGTLIPMIVVRAVVFPLFLKSQVGLPAWQYCAMHARSVGIALAYLVLVGGLSLVPLTTYARFLGLCVASTAVYALLLAVASPDARSAAVDVLRRGQRMLGRWSALREP